MSDRRYFVLAASGPELLSTILRTCEAQVRRAFPEAHIFTASTYTSVAEWKRFRGHLLAAATDLVIVPGPGGEVAQGAHQDLVDALAAGVRCHVYTEPEGQVPRFDGVAADPFVDMGRGHWRIIGSTQEATWVPAKAERTLEEGAPAGEVAAGLVGAVNAHPDNDARVKRAEAAMLNCRPLGELLRQGWSADVKGGRDPGDKLVTCYIFRPDGSRAMMGVVHYDDAGQWFNDAARDCQEDPRLGEDITRPA